MSSLSVCAGRQPAQDQQPRAHPRSDHARPHEIWSRARGADGEAPRCIRKDIVSLTPRAVVVHRPTEYDELIARHRTRGQAAFLLSSRGPETEEVEGRHARQLAAMTAVTSSRAVHWR